MRYLFFSLLIFRHKSTDNLAKTLKEDVGYLELKREMNKIVGA